MASFKQYTASGGASEAFSIPTFSSDEIKVYVDNVLKTAATHYNITSYTVNGGTVTWTEGNVPNGVVVRIVRDTGVTTARATYAAGSSIKADDLNNNQTQVLRSLEEQDDQLIQRYDIENNAISADQIAASSITESELNAEAVTTTKINDSAITTAKITDSAVTTAKIADSNITTAKINNDAVTADKIGANAVVTAGILDANVTTAKIAADAVTNAKIADNSIDSEHYVDGSIDTVHLADDSVTSAKLAAGAIDTSDLADSGVTTAKIADSSITTTKLATNAVTTVKISDGTITTAKLASGLINTDKLGNDSVTSAKIADDSIDSEHLAADSIDTEHYAAGSVDTTALGADSVTGAKIADDAINSEHYTDGSIDTVHIADAQITTAKIADSNITTAKIADSNITTAKIADDAVTGSKIAHNTITVTNMAANSVDSTQYVDGSIDTEHIADNAVTSAKIAANAVTTTEIADAELTTLAGMQSGTASILAGGTALTATLAEINTVVDGKSVETTISNTDAAYPTSGAVVDYVAAQIAPIGGLEVIANDASFPNTQPQAGVVISIADAGGLVVNGSGSSTTARTLGGSTVTINSINSSYNSSTVTDGVGFLVSSTGSGQIYNFHKSVIRDQDILSISSDINDFANRYRVASSAPTSSKDDGDLWFDTANGKMMVYNANTTAWEEVSAIGNFNINTISSSGNTGGGSATFNGTAYRFVISNPPQDAQQLLVSINGVIQKPNAGTSQPSEGFAISGNDIIFAAAPASGSDYFITTLGQSVQIGTPSDNTVSTAKIQNLAVTGDKVATNLDLADNKKIRFGTGNDLTIYHDGTNSYLDNDTGGVRLNTASGEIEINKATNEYMARFITDGGVELYYNNAKKFHTISSGTVTTGHHYLLDSDKLKLGDSEDLQIYHDGSHSYIKDAGTGNLKVQSDSSIVTASTKVQFESAAEDEVIAVFYENSRCELYYDNAKKFETTADGVTVSGDLNLQQPSSTTNYIQWDNSEGKLKLKDDIKITVGDGEDLQIYHDGDNSFIKDTGTGRLSICTSQLQLTNAADSEVMIKATEDGAVELYYDNAKKFDTNAGGAECHGNLLFDDSYALYLGNSYDLQIYHDATDSYITSATGELRIYSNGGILRMRAKANENAIIAVPDAEVQLYYDNVKKLETYGSGVKTYGGYLRIVGNEGGTAELNLYADEGDDAYDIWQVKAGGSSDFYIAGWNGGSYETSIKATGDGAVELYHDNAKKFETTANGITVGNHIWTTGGNYTLGNNMYVLDGGRIDFGTDEDLKIFHDSTNSNNKVQFDQQLLFRPHGSGGTYENSAAFNINGSVDLYYDDVKRFETSSNGYTLKHSSGDVQYYHNRTIADVAGTYYFDLTSTSGFFIFRTSSSSSLDIESFKITNGGVLYNNCVSTHTASLTLRKGHSDANGVDYFQCRDSTNALKMRVEGDGDVANANNSYGSTSDVKLKENIVDANSQWNDIKAVKVRNFNFKTDPDKKLLGVVAQEVETVSAGLVSESIDRNPDTGEDLGTKTKTVKYSILYMKAIKALQEAMAKIETLETKVAALEAK